MAFCGVGLKLFERKILSERAGKGSIGARLLILATQLADLQPGVGEWCLDVGLLIRLPGVG